jgi:DNA-binding CsgD family transcriptional regulator
VAAWGAAITVAGRSGSGADVFLDVCNSVRALRSPPGDRRSLQLLLGPGTENHAHSAAAVLYNGLARYDEAAASAKQATSNAFDLWTRMWALPELVEAAARAGDTEPARDAFEGCRKRRSPPVPTGRSESRHAAARCSPTGPLPKSSTGSDRTVWGKRGSRPELGRAQLLYGEWLCREGRRVDAREQLHAANDMFVAIGMEAFAERARREVVATGEHVHRRALNTRVRLTPQKAQIAQLASDGLTNQEIGAQLFLSPRTVEWHLRKSYTKPVFDLGGSCDADSQTRVWTRG